MKVCSKCGKTKSLPDFHKDSSRKDGLFFWCKSCVKVKSKKYYDALPKSVRLEKKRHYNKNNKVKINFKQASWRKENPEKHAAIQATRRASKLQATPVWLTDCQKDQIKSFYTLARKFELIFGLCYHVDHIVPLKGKNVCGLHVPWNLQILESSLNMSKGNR